MLKKLGVVAAIFVALLCLLLLIVRPYRRLEHMTQRIIQSYAPDGTRVGGVTVRFPASITITKLEVPLRVNGQERRFRVEKLRGNLSLLPLLKGVADAELNSDFFGGVLWVKAQTGADSAGSAGSSSRILFDARARGMDLSQLCKFLEAPVSATGRIDLDMDGNMDKRNPLSISGEALAIGKQVEVPSVVLESLVLPANRAGEVLSRISAENGNLTIREFKLTGTAYNITGTGTVALKEPAEQSPLDCSLGILFKERFSITDRRLSRDSAESIVNALVSSKSKVFFKISGTVGDPKGDLDTTQSLGPLLNYLGK